MNALIIKENNLPSTIEDISKFVLVGREKIISIRAEIRAIDKLNLAQDVRNQKREECSMLAESLLDAEIKLGDLLKLVPKLSGKRTDLAVKQISAELKEPIDSGVGKLEIIKPKHEVITDLGFSQKQAERFETLADNKDLVEQVKQEARVNDDIPTRTRVLQLAKARKQKENEKIGESKDDEPLWENYSQSQERKRKEKEEEDYKEYCQYIDECKKISIDFNNFFLKCFVIKTDDETLNKWKEFLKDKDSVRDDLKSISIGISKLLKLQKFLNEEMKK